MTETIVYRDYTQVELDQNYDQSTLVKNLPEYVDRWRREVEQAKKSLRCELNVSYGDSADQVIDIYGVDVETEKPIVLNLHGGAWRQMSAATSASAAKAFVNVGTLFAVPDFSLAPAVRLDEMVRQCREAVQFLFSNARRYGGNPNRLYVIGHSSGAHLAAMVAQQEPSVKAFAACSGIYDLEPVRLSARNNYLYLDEASAVLNSPITIIGKNTPPALVAWGTDELPEFQRQSNNFADTLRALRCSVRTLEQPGLNHFDMFDQIADDTSRLFQEIKILFGI